MLEILAGGGQYIAIFALCVSCWAAGRSVRKPALLTDDRAGWDPRPPLHLARANLPGPSQLAAGFSAAQSEKKADAVETESEMLFGRAAQVHDLIVTGDLSQDGVLEALVAMAEEQSVEPQQCARPAWHSSNGSRHAPGSCEQPRILTRKVATPEPLPAELADPLTPEVLARYRLYAQEHSAIV